MRDHKCTQGRELIHASYMDVRDPTSRAIMVCPRVCVKLGTRIKSQESNPDITVWAASVLSGVLTIAPDAHPLQRT